MSEHAPSLIFEALAAVIVPFLAKAGLRDANLSGKNFWHSSSLLILFSLPLLSCSTISTISQSKIPFSYASLAFWYDLMANSS
jgi:hypothetical protein